MLKYVTTFNVLGQDVDQYTAADITARIKRLDGVTSVHMYRTTTLPQVPAMGDLKQSPHYCMEIELAQESPMVLQVMNGMYMEYADYVSDLTFRAYRQLA